MAVVRTYLLSSLAAERASLAGGFPERFPFAWLVWEPGKWKPTPRSATTTMIRGLPREPSGPRPVVTGGGDPLCWELRERAPFKVGRSPDCDVRLNEETVSRDHLWLDPAPDGGWVARPASPTSVTYVNGRALPGDGLALAARGTLELGNVVLTFETAATLLQRVDGLRQER